MAVLWLSLCLLLLSMAQEVPAQSGGGGALQEREPQWDGGSAGMQVLYNMQNGFLGNMIQIKTIGKLLTDYQINYFSDLGDEVFLNQWDQWILFFVGYMVCVGIGTVMAFALPIAGCCVCAYRSCDCCVSCCECCECCTCCLNVDKRETFPKWSCRRTGYSVAVGVCACVLLASVTCSFVALGQLREQVQPYGILDTALQSMYAVDDYADDVVIQLDSAIIGQTQDTLGFIETILTNFPDVIISDLGQDLGVLPDLRNYDQFVENLPYLRDNLTLIQNLTDTLAVDANILESGLTGPRTDLASLLGVCAPAYPECQTALDQLPDLTIATDYNGLPILNDLIMSINFTLGNDIIARVAYDSSAFWNLSTALDAEFNSTLSGIVSQLQEAEKAIVDGAEDLKAEVNGINLTSLEQAVWDFKPTFMEYGMMTYWGFVGFTSLCTLIIFFYVLGMILGLVLPPPTTDRDPTCCEPTSKQGSALLMTATGLSFVFSWLIAILTIVLFISGGLVETNFCRHVVSYDSSMDQIERLVLNELEASGVTYNLSLKQVTLDCQDNQSLYITLDMEENGFNVTELLDLEVYGVYDAIDAIRNITLFLPAPINFYTNHSDFYDVVVDLNQVNFSAYDAILNTGITKVELGGYIQDLDDIVAMLNDHSQLTLASLINDQADILKTLYSNTYAYMALDRLTLQGYYDNVMSLLGVFDVPEGLDRLQQAEDNLTMYGNSTINSTVDELCDTIEGSLRRYSAVVEASIRQDLGACRSLFDAGASLVDGACVYFLSPYNALWFCLGWFLTINILAVAFANELAFVFSARVDKPEPEEESDEGVSKEEPKKKPTKKWPKANKVVPVVAPVPVAVVSTAEGDVFLMDEDPPYYEEPYTFRYQSAGQKSRTVTPPVPSATKVSKDPGANKSALGQDNKVAPASDETAFLKSDE